MATLVQAVFVVVLEVIEGADHVKGRERKGWENKVR